MNLSRRDFLHYSAVSAAISCMPGLGWAANPLDGGGGQRKKPNILLVVSDDQGYSDLGCCGDKQVRTPHLDGLAAGGVRSTDFYSAAPLCSPARAALMTGRYPHRTGLADGTLTVKTRMGVGLRHEEKLLSEYLQEAGYRTGAFGKWNLGFGEGSRPTERGFDQFFGNPSGGLYWFNGDYDKTWSFYRGTEQVRADGYSTDLYTDAALDFLRQDSDKPFFTYVAYNAPHLPIAMGANQPWAPPEYVEMFKHAGRRTQYLASLTAMDAAIGRMLKLLDETDRTRDTIVIFFSDNGGEPKYANNRPFRGGKNSLLEGGIRVPCIVRWPGVLPAGETCSAPWIAMDLFSLCLEAAAVKPPSPEERIIDGRDPCALLAGKEDTLHDGLFFRHGNARCVRSGKWKADVRKNRLYDLESDPREQKDLSKSKPDLLAQLAKQYTNWNNTVEISKHGI